MCVCVRGLVLYYHGAGNKRARLREQLHSLNIIFDDGAMLAFEQAFESNMNNDWGNEADIFPSQDGNAPFGN